ncbi:hypothetical protein [Salinibacillus xinjiangensis]|uniref:Uncharacterized protein n=1 Tax=Salinibacillus xinjiangensis TaxID=1229268 RepID=A0A6G1X3U7_9BACI|nr:hypothetical protein [Salinibacillus xinjiangensis]MRG85622.1 hypothetical protein [Salinibacillus xinjiangensis]
MWNNAYNWMFFIVLSGFLFIFWLWPSDNNLPQLGNIEPFTMETVQGNQYQLDNDKIKLVTFTTQVVLIFNL